MRRTQAFIWPDRPLGMGDLETQRSLRPHTQSSKMSGRGQWKTVSQMLIYTELETL